MIAAAQPPSTSLHDDEESRVLLRDVPWATYVVLRDTVDGPGIRMTYLKGVLELVSTSRRHEVSKKQIARLLELFCLERGIALYGYGSTTFRSEARERGLEPDDCDCRGVDGETPQLAIEVIVGNPLLDKLEVYRGLGIGELWLFQARRFRVMVLREDGYEAALASLVFPEIDLDRLAHWTVQVDQAAALLGYRDEIRRV